MIGKRAITEAALLAVLVMVGCGSSGPKSDREQVRSVTNDYAAAFADGNFGKVCSLMTSEAKTALLQAAPFVGNEGGGCAGLMKAVASLGDPGTKADFANFHIKSILIAGSSATVRTTGDTTRLKKKAGHWLIDLDEATKEGSSSSPSPSPDQAQAATVAQLSDLAARASGPIYWAGERSGFTYELTRSHGNTYIRYLPPGVRVGDKRPDFLTIGTYPEKDSYNKLRAQAHERKNRAVKLPTGGIAVWSTTRPQSIYLSDPDSDAQVEVYEPSAAKARQLAVSGHVVPVR